MDLVNNQRLLPSVLIYYPTSGIQCLPACEFISFPSSEETDTNEKAIFGSGQAGACLLHMSFIFRLLHLFVFVLS